MCNRKLGTAEKRSRSSVCLLKSGYCHWMGKQLGSALSTSKNIGDRLHVNWRVRVVNCLQSNEGLIMWAPSIENKISPIPINVRAISSDKNRVWHCRREKKSLFRNLILEKCKNISYPFHLWAMAWFTNEHLRPGPGIPPVFFNCSYTLKKNYVIAIF